jgi:hypothetical protein
MSEHSDRGAIFTRVLDDGRVIDLWPQLYNYKLSISENLAAAGCLDEW